MCKLELGSADLKGREGGGNRVTAGGWDCESQSYQVVRGERVRGGRVRGERVRGRDQRRTLLVPDCDCERVAQSSMNKSLHFCIECGRKQSLGAEVGREGKR